MAHHIVHLALAVLLATASAEKESSRWSRQISSYTSDISDWVPLPGPTVREPPAPPQIKRQAVAEPRILTEPFPGFSRPTGFGQDPFLSRSYFNTPNKQLYLQSVPSAPQNFLTDQGFGQSIRFGLSQPNFPLSQGFVAPQFPFDAVPSLKPRPPQPPQIKFESFPKANLPSLPPPQAKPFLNPIPKKPEQPKFVDGYRVENVTDFSGKKKPQSLQKIQFDNNDRLPKIEPQSVAQNKAKIEREEVQLLYVPVESLNRGQFNFRNPVASPQILNSDLYSQGLPKPTPVKNFAPEFQRPAVKPTSIENFSGQDYYNNFNAQIQDFDKGPKFSTATSPFPTVPPTTPKPKKLKPHQPPLAIFLTQEAKKSNQIKVGDVLSSLKNANTIAVLDTVNPQNAPKVFIGPSSLQPPETFVKFELPYLSNIENSDKKLRQLPFFVAPLSYNTPQGFAKIPFPSPHVGSVVINSQIKDAPPAPPVQATASVIPNAYTGAPPKPVTQKPNYNYYTTVSPKTNAPIDHKLNYYSFEPQTVTSVRPSPKEPEVISNPPPPKTNSYFIDNSAPQYNPQQYVSFPSQSDYKVPETVRQYTVPKPETTTTIRTTTTTTTPKPQSTYPSQLLETHNPYSINQAFHFSTPLDYHSYMDEDNFATPGSKKQPPSPPPISTNPPPSPTPKPEEKLPEKPKQSSPNYLQNYTPEIHYESDIINSRYPVFNTNDYTTKPELTSENNPPPQTNTNNYQSNNDNFQPISGQVPSTDYNTNTDSQQPTVSDNLTETISKFSEPSDAETPPSRYEYNQYDNGAGYDSNESKSSTSTTTTTTTTTRRTPTRTRGRPRYTTTPRTESNEYSTRTVITRRPLRERRPPANRPRYEPNKITTEKPIKKPLDSNESTTKSSRQRMRGRVHYKPSENDEYYEKKNKGRNSKEDDLAYQRDVLHQNYPVTLMERMSTVNIDAITDPSISTKNVETTEALDTENAYTNERLSISQQTNTESKEDIPVYVSRTKTEAPYVPKLPSTQEYIYQSRSSLAPIDAISSYGETSPEREEDYPQQTTPVQKSEKPEVAYATEPSVPEVEENNSNYSGNNEYSTAKDEAATPEPELEMTKVASQEINHEVEPEDNVVQTTPSYNRVRVRPGVIRQYHQASTESSRTRTRRPTPAVTYRPAFDRRRTTMRIEEIAADLKTKQVHARPEVQDYRHPVYKPEPTTEASAPSALDEATTKRGVFRRRRPSYSTTSTELPPSTKKIYEVKNRFRGRRPTTERPTEKPEIQTESTSTTVRNSPYNRYTHRPKLSERYNKKPEPEETAEDQDSNFSINRPKYATLDNEQWSPKISTDSFKPYNPNDIVEESKIATTERRSDSDSELDIITARNEYEDILISVTPASNRLNKKIPDIPPTLEALVEQSKVTKSDDAMSTFESMLEEVMKSLEEQDENEYTTNVMKHKGGEIGEIPPERIITSGENFYRRNNNNEEETTTAEPKDDDSTLQNEGEGDRRGRRRGFWKKVKVRPVATESIEVAESQYYSNTVNRLGQSVKPSLHEKSGKPEKSKISVTTYKPSFQYKDIFANDDEELPNLDVLPTVDIPKIEPKLTNKSVKKDEAKQTTVSLESETPTARPEVSPGDMDLGTGSPDPTLADIFDTTPTEPTSSEADYNVDRSNGFSLMDYLFGVTSNDNEHAKAEKNDTKVEKDEKPDVKSIDIEITTEQAKPKTVATENTYIPEEITTEAMDDFTESASELEITKVKPDQEKVEEATEISVVKVESSSVSSFMNPDNVISTSMSTEVSHETEICFRGKCIKTSKDIL